MSAFRALRQLTAASSSTSRSLLARQLSTSVSRVSARAGIANAARFSTPARAFSVSARRFGEGSTDLALSQKLHEELKYEKENEAEVGVTPEWLKAFQESGVWKIEDAAGNDEIILSRSFGNENLRLIFSIADISSAEENYAAEEEAAEEGQEDDFNMYPIRAALSITKNNGPGCLNVDMVCQEGNFVVENVSFYKDSKLGTELTAEADWKRRGVYIGPQFDTLDVALQDEFEKFLQERGVDEHIANFIPQYAEYKEQKEYMQWLNNVKSFVDQ